MPRATTRRSRVPRVRERRPDERPPEIMDAALRVFLAQGYQATRLEQVAEAAGVTKGAIYHYFDGKDDLLMQAVRSRLAATFADVEPALARRDAPASARLRLLLRRAWRTWTEPGWARAFTMLLGELQVQFPALVQTFLDEGPRHGWRLIEQLLEEGKASGEFRADVDATIAARFVVAGLVMQVVLQSALPVEPDEAFDPDRIFDSSVEVWFRGLQPALPAGLPAAAHRPS